MEAIRFAYGNALAELGKQYQNLVVLDADVSNSTRSIEFGAKYLDRFFNIGIAEANMVCMAAGLSTMGFIPVVNTFSFLLCERALDQIRASVASNTCANYGRGTSGKSASRQSSEVTCQKNQSGQATKKRLDEISCRCLD